MNEASDHGPWPIGLPTSQTVEVPAGDGRRGLISTTTEIPGQP